MPIRVWDFSQNKAVTVDDREAEKGVAEGRYALRQKTEDTQEEIRVPVLSPSGKEGTIPSSKAQEAFQKGFRLRGREDIKSPEQVKEEAYREVAAEKPGLAFSKAALGTATFGLSDVAARAAGVEREFGQALEEENPLATTAGVIAGAVTAPAAIPGKLVAKGAKALGQAAGASTGSRLTGKIAEYGAEGLAYGMGESVSDLALGNPEEVATNLILGGGVGAAFAGVGGVAAPIAKKITSKALEIGERTATRAYSGLTESVVKGVTRATRGKEVADELGKVIEEVGPDGEKIYKKALSLKTGAELEQAKREGKEYLAKLTGEERALSNEISADIDATRKALGLQKTEAEKAVTAEKEALAQQSKAAKREALLARRGELVEEAEAKKADLARQQEVTGLKSARDAELEAAQEGFDIQTQQTAQLIDESRNRLTTFEEQTARRLDELEAVAQEQPRLAASMFGELMNDVDQIYTHTYSEGMDRLIRGVGGGRVTEAEARTAQGMFYRLVKATEGVSGGAATKLNQRATEAWSNAVSNASKIKNTDIAMEFLDLRRQIYQTLGPKAAEGAKRTDTEQLMYNLTQELNNAIEGLSRRAENGALFSEGISAIRTADKMWVHKSYLDKATRGYKKKALVDDSQRFKPQFSITKTASEMTRTPESSAEFSILLNKMPEMLDFLEEAGIDVAHLAARLSPIERVAKEGAEAVAQVKGVKAAARKTKTEMGQEIRELSAKQKQLRTDLRKQKKAIRAEYAKKLAKPELKAKTATKIQAELDAKLAKLDEKLANLDTPEAPSNLGVKQEIVEAIKNKIQMTHGTPEEAAEVIMTVIGKDPKKVMARKQALKEASQFMAENPNMTTIDKYAHMLKRLGETNPEDIKKLDDLVKYNQTRNWLKDNLQAQDQLTRADIIGPLAIGGSLATGNPLLAAASMAVSKAIHLVNSPYSALAAVPVVESVARSGKAFMDKAQKKLVDSLASKATARAVVGAELNKSNYEKRTKQLKAARDPEVLQRNMTAALDHLSGTPNVQFALMNRTIRANQYLQTQIPEDPLAEDMLNPAMSQWQPSSQDMAKFNRSYDVVENPGLAIEHLANGTITPEEAEAIQVVHPEIFEKMQGMVVAALTEMKEPVSYDKRVSLSIMFGMPTDPTLNGEYIQSVQEMINGYNKQEQKPSSNLKFDSETLLSDNQRISMR